MARQRAHAQAKKNELHMSMSIASLTFFPLPNIFEWVLITN